MSYHSNSVLKKIMYFLFVTSLLLLLAACGNGENEESSTTNSDEKEVFNLKMNSVNQPSLEGTPQTIGESVFIDLVKEKTDGQVEIEMFYSNQLVGQSESLDALAKGTIDLQVIAPSAWSDKIPEGDWTSLLFAWDSADDAHHLIRETDVGDLYAEALEEYGVTPLHYYFNAGTGHLSKVPIAKPEDFQGIVVNAPSKLRSDYYTGLGAGTASIPFAEYYEGLLRGTIDAVLFPFNALESMKLAEVVDYMTVPGELSTVPTLVAMSTQTWDKLPSDLQELVMEAALEAEQLSIEASKTFTDESIDYAKENGVEVVELTGENRQEFAEYAQKYMWDEYKEINDRTKRIIEVIKENME